ncbi:hypothetical protein BD769DRAFT_1385279 [Suillus cothurnatus]|nr:hypothetical protein BD769DRAFT_1385279 [Suillus cothurnatus]
MTLHYHWNAMQYFHPIYHSRIDSQVDTLHSSYMRSTLGDINLKLRESVAVARYIDRVSPEPSLHISLDYEKAIIEEQMWECVSLLSKKGDSAIREQIEPAVELLERLLGKMAELMAGEGYVFESKLSWADFFLFPLIAFSKNAELDGGNE